MKLLRAYAKFQEQVLQNPWRATQLYEEADKLEEQQAVVQDNMLLGANAEANMLTQVDDKTNGEAARGWERLGLGDWGCGVGAGAETV